MELPYLFDESISPYEFIFLIQELVSNGVDGRKLNFGKFNHFLALIETEHGYYHMVLDSQHLN